MCGSRIAAPLNKLLTKLTTPTDIPNITTNQ